MEGVALERTIKHKRTLSGPSDHYEGVNAEVRKKSREDQSWRALPRQGREKLPRQRGTGCLAPPPPHPPNAQEVGLALLTLTRNSRKSQGGGSQFLGASVSVPAVRPGKNPLRGFTNLRVA